MNRKFSGQLNKFVRQAGLPLRRLARQSGIPHQTIFNWMRGTQPRWYAALDEDLHRLGSTLGLNDDEITLLLRSAGCIPSRFGLFEIQEVPMEGSYLVPKGWCVSGDAPEMYEIGLDPTVTYENNLCVTIKSRPAPTGFAALLQEIKAEAYRGKRLRFSAAVRPVDVENRAALFMRIDDASGKMLAFDNMRNRPVTGTSDWGHHAIVLDIASDAEVITFGIFLSLKGQVWMSDVSLSVVDKDVPTTDILAVTQYFPVNLDFKE